MTNKKNPFENREIFQITIIAGAGKMGIYNVGENGVDEIKDCSIEYEDSIYSAFHCFDKDGKIIKIIENCPVDISYREKK